jgi:hypothetical protein
MHAGHVGRLILDLGACWNRIIRVGDHALEKRAKPDSVKPVIIDEEMGLPTMKPGW